MQGDDRARFCTHCGKTVHNLPGVVDGDLDDLIDALRAKDGEWAEAVMRAHILAARTTVIESMRDEDEGVIAANHNGA